MINEMINDDDDNRDVSDDKRDVNDDKRDVNEIQ